MTRRTEPGTLPAALEAILDDLCFDLNWRGIKIDPDTVRDWPVWKLRAARLWLDRFPSFDDWIEERKALPHCRVCGCTDDDACPDGCEWVERNLCSACATAAGQLVLGEPESERRKKRVRGRRRAARR
jgi:hypothetical protein